MRLITLKPLQIGLLCIGLALGLTACFRDASNNSPNPTVVDVSDILPTSTPRPTETQAPPTFTPAPEVDATKTLIVGGPPAEDDQTADDGEDTGEEETPFVPTFTPVPPGDATLAPPGLSDTGISPTPRSSPTSDSPLDSTPTAVEEEDECIYIVQSGDTLFSIAGEYELFPEDFYPLNPALAANPNALQLGQEIRIPGCETTPTPEVTTTGTPGTPQATADVPPGARTHTVREGDTLFSIAQQYGVTVQDIVDATDFLVTENTIIQPGDVLIIPPAE